MKNSHFCLKGSCVFKQVQSFASEKSLWANRLDSRASSCNSSVFLVPGFPLKTLCSGGLQMSLLAGVSLSNGAYA